MRIECAKSTKPLGVRGYGEAAFLFCPDPLKGIGRGKRKKFCGSKILLKECQECEYFRNEHKSMDVDFKYTNPFGESAKIGEKKMIITESDIQREEEKKNNWEREEAKRITEKEITEKR